LDINTYVHITYPDKPNIGYYVVLNSTTSITRYGNDDEKDTKPSNKHDEIGVFSQKFPSENCSLLA